MPDLKSLAFDQEAAAADALASACETWLGDFRNGLDSEIDSFITLRGCVERYSLAGEWFVHNACDGRGCDICDDGHLPGLYELPTQAEGKP